MYCTGQGRNIRGAMDENDFVAMLQVRALSSRHSRLPSLERMRPSDRRRPSPAEQGNAPFTTEPPSCGVGVLVMDYYLSLDCFRS